MYPGEIVVARISGGASIRRCLEATEGQVRVSLGRNREARLPRDRIMLSTGISADTEDQVEEFRQRCADLSAEIDLTEVWEVVHGESTPLSLDDLGELLWAQRPDAAQRVALLLHLEQSTLHFAEQAGVYVARSREDVEETLARRRRESENARSAEELAADLSAGALPLEMDQHQRALLEHLRGFAVHGGDYTRSEAARALLERLPGGARELQRLSFELLVKVGVFSQDEPLELERAGIVDRFSNAVLSESEAIELAQFLDDPNRKDLTDLAVVTIDDVETEDRDDALSLEVEPYGYRIGVHIADAGRLIAPDSSLNGEADRRMATLYIPEGKVSMLPARISGQLGSLVPHERRLAVSVLIHLNEGGDILKWEVAPSVVCSHAALSYQDADEAIEESSHPWHNTLAELNRAARALCRKRLEAGALLFDQREMRISVSPSGEIDVRVARRTPARQLVAELMILCNSLLAQFCLKEGLPATYRSQSIPDLADLGVDTSAATVIEGDPARMYQLMRRLPSVELSTTPAAHAGLGVPAYIQATSPLRRYPDLAMQRQISHFLSAGEPLYSEEATASIAARAEVQLRELSKIEDERRRYWFLKYLQKTRLAAPDNGGGEDTFQAVVLANQPRRTALLELCEYPFRVRAELVATQVPGDTVTLRLHGVDLWRRTGQFVQVREAS